MSERLYVLGHPVAHSKSPAMHNAAYRVLGLDWEYGFADFASADEAADFLERGDWLGLNITMPYKPLAFAAADSATEEARLAGGANVLARCGGKLRADNTDGKGCVAYLRRCGVEFEGSRVVVCGTGPTSQSIMHAVAQSGAERVSLLGRDDVRAREVVEAYLERRVGSDVARAGANVDACLQQRVGGAGGQVRCGSYELMAGDIETADVIVDATPLGMTPGDPAPFDAGLLSPNQFVFDVVYGHGETALANAARNADCEFRDGAGMLVAQAVETIRDFLDWLGISVNPDDVDLFPLMSDAAGFSL